MNYYEAKFAREAKETPKNWVIQAVRGGYKLVKVGRADV